jgi:hypothetical protein
MLLESKSLLAKLMATENLVVEQRKVSTAMFDTVSRVLVVPILNNKIPAHTYDLFMGHEVGHALWTPPNGHEIREKYGVPHSIANLVEDSRIERKIKYKYPGLKNSFVRGYKDLLDRNFFETKGVNINTMKFVDRLNLHCKGGAFLNVQFTEQEMELVRAVESTETYDDVMVVCQKIIKFIKETTKKQETVQLPMLIDDEEEDDLSDLIMHDDEEDDDEVEDDGKSETAEEEEDDFEGTGEVSSSDEVETEESEEDEEDEEDPENSNEDSDEKTGSDDVIDEEIEELLESETDMAYKNNEYKLFSQKSLDYTYANIPKLTAEQTVVDFKKVYEMYEGYKNKVYWKNNYNPYDYEGFKTLRDEIKTGVSYLVKEFEMRKSADQMKKASTAKTGDLNLKKIYSHEFNEDIFKKITVVPGAKSHGLVIFLDWSGSMTTHIQNTLKQLFNIVMFCKKVNIPYEVYTFTNPATPQLEFAQKKVPGDLLMDYFCLLNVLSSRMNAAQFSKAAAALVYVTTPRREYYSEKIIPDIFSMNGTPLNQTIVSAMEIVPEFQRKYGLQVVNTIFLTDGEGDAGLDIIDDDTSKIRIGSWNYRNNSPNTLIIRDPVTKYYEKVDYTSSRTITSAFIKLFKYRAKCNIVGFYILSPSEFKGYIQRQFGNKGVSLDDTQDIRANFSKNSCAVINNDGFDEYYLLKSVRGDNEEPELVVKENASNKSMANAFTKYNNKRNTNRIVLNRFINMIA